MATEREAALEEAAAMLDSWAEHDEKEGEDEIAAANRNAAACIRGLKDRTARRPCECPGCTEDVEAYSRSGLCGPCADEDCEHEEVPDGG